MGEYCPIPYTNQEGMCQSYLSSMPYDCHLKVAPTKLPPTKLPELTQVYSDILTPSEQGTVVITLTASCLKQFYLYFYFFCVIRSRVTLPFGMKFNFFVNYCEVMDIGVGIMV